MGHFGDRSLRDGKNTIAASRITVHKVTTFSIIEARPWHCGQMCRMLRSEHRELIASIGIDSHRELRARFDQSSFRRAWLIDGQLAGLGGVTGSILTATGYVWLALSRDALRFPVAAVKEVRRQLEIIMVCKRELVTTIIDGDEASKRFAIFLGFVSGDHAPASPRYGRRYIARRFDDDPDWRVPVGGGYATAMAYRTAGI